jgi:tetratricopeptide (TPR) repeat protein
MSALDRFDETPDIRLPLYLENIFQKLTEDMINADNERIMEIRKRLVREQYAAEEARQKQIEEQKRIQDAQDKFKAAGQMINEGDFDTAEALLRELLEQDPDNGNVLFYLAQVYAQRQDYDQALEYYLKASDSGKIQDWVRAWSLLRAGRYYAAKQNYEEARRIFEQVLKLDGDLRGALEEAEQLIGRLPKE